MSSKAPVIHWFRRDLRLADNPALQAAAASGRPVIPVFVLGEDGPQGRPAGGASRWWLHGSLESLGAALAARGNRLVLRHGDPVEQLGRIADRTGAVALHFMRGHEPGDVAAEQRLQQALGTRIELRRSAGGLLFEPERIATGTGQPYKVFTPFWKACLAQAEPPEPGPSPARLPGFAGELPSDRLDDWGLRPTAPDWAGGLRDAWQPGEKGAEERLDAFLDEAAGAYRDQRDRPDQPGTSRLSPYLHFGEIGVRTVWHAARAHAVAHPGSGPGVDAFVRELGWREFSAHLLFHWPELPSRPLRAEFERFPWREDPESLDLWQRGLTGYPIVDAGMRELWTTGWMHNRVRMVAASFLVKDLLIPWQAGEAWFWDTLVDADLANNAASWQWVAGCGADAAPFFRIFNPVLQGRRFDPDGAYVSRWIPELRELDAGHRHAPWDAPEAARRRAGIGDSYPCPVVDHAEARRRALAAFESLKD